MLLDAHNADNRGCHAAIVLSAPETSAGYTFDGWFTDEQRTVGPTIIPFGTDGSFRLYAKLTKNELALADNSSNAEAIAAAASSGKVYVSLYCTYTESCFFYQDYGFCIDAHGNCGFFS